MDILFLGYSNLLKKRILPILDQLQELKKISIAKFKEQSWDDALININKELVLFDNYEDAIKRSNAELVYISTVNSSHFELASRCLAENFHVIIDKPATSDLKEATELIETALNKNLLLAESTVYLYHPQFSLTKEILNNERLVPKFLTLNFSFPPLNSDNFRYNKNLGGGAILDTGIYAVSPGRFFFDDIPQNVNCIINSNFKDVETSYSLLVKYSQGRSMIGHFGFTTEYINRLNILGDNFSIDLDRVFTIPDDIENRIVLRKNNVVSEFYAPKANTFVAFLRTVIDSINQNNFKSFSTHLMMDAIAMDAIKKSI